jgi:predicted nucleic acid-binding protein
VAGVVVDASVAVKWFIAEERSEAARAVRGSGVDLLAPSSVIFEIYHALWEAARKGRIPGSFPRDAASLIPSPFTKLVPIEDLFDSATMLATELKHPVYDCVYLALAQEQGVEIVTADRELARAGRRANIRTRVI